MTSNAYQEHAAVFDDLQYHWYRTWDYQWTFHLWERDGLGIVPRCNLINNIGMGDAEGEHPGDSQEKVEYISKLKREEISLPIKYPEKVERNIDYDMVYQNESFPKKRSVFARVKSGLRACYYEWLYKQIKLMENDEKYYRDCLEEKYKLNAEEQRYNNGDKYRLISTKEMRKSAWKYIRYRFFI